MDIIIIIVVVDTHQHVLRKDIDTILLVQVWGASSILPVVASCVPRCHSPPTSSCGQLRQVKTVWKQCSDNRISHTWRWAMDGRANVPLCSTRTSVPVRCAGMDYGGPFNLPNPGANASGCRGGGGGGRGGRGGAGSPFVPERWNPPSVPPPLYGSIFDWSFNGWPSTATSLAVFVRAHKSFHNRKF